MLFDWKGRPTLMMPTLAFAVQKPGQRWVRASATAVALEADAVSETEFWRRFASWDLPPFPVSFAMIDKPTARSRQGTCSR
jgi:hypothetical protein